MKVVIKIGTHALLTESGNLNQLVMDSIVSQIATLRKRGHAVLLVSSGAVALGRVRAKNELNTEYGDTIACKQLLASLGQHELMRAYAEAFKEHALLSAQLLISRHDFNTEEHDLNIQRLLSKMINDKSIVPVINENDSTVIEGLVHTFTDNDELAGIIAKQINADKLILLTNVAGVFDKDPQEPGAKLVEQICPFDESLEISTAKTIQGRGGMANKLATARKASASGIISHIADASEPEVVLKIMAGNSVGTTILGQTSEQAYDTVTAG